MVQMSPTGMQLKGITLEGGWWLSNDWSDILGLSLGCLTILESIIFIQVATGKTCSIRDNISTAAANPS